MDTWCCWIVVELQCLWKKHFGKKTWQEPKT